MLCSQREERTILIVDDEPQVAVALADIFEDDYRVITETSGRSALEVLKGESGIATILCDQRMPGMSGDELLAEAKNVSLASRLLITGYADLQAVIRAVNEGQIFGYVSKPWDPDGIRITVHKAVEYYELRRALNQERALLRDLMRHSPDAIAFKDRELRYVHLNEAEARRVGAPDPASALARPASDFLPTDRSRRLAREERALLRSGKQQLDRIESVITPDGGTRWYAANKAAIRAEQGAVTGLVAITRDITAQKWTETGLELLLGLTNTMSAAQDFAAALAVSLERICRTFGWEYAETWRHQGSNGKLALGRCFYGEGDGVARFREAVGALSIRRGEGPVGRAWKNQQPELLVDIDTSRTRHCTLARTMLGCRSILAVPILGRGTVDAVLVFYSTRPMADGPRVAQLIGGVAEQMARVLAAKRGESELRQSEEQFRSLVEGSIQGILIHRGGDMLFANQALAQIFGYDEPAELLALGALERLVAPDEVERLYGYAEARLCGREAPAQYEFRGRRKDGSLIWLECRASATPWADGSAILGTFVDITERKQALEALRKNEASLAAAQRTAQIGSWTWEVGSGRAVPSRELCRILGLSEDAGDFSFESFLPMVPEGDRPALESAFAKVVAEGGKQELSCRLVRADGEERHVVIEFEVECDTPGRARRMTGIVQDVTERSRLEQQLRQSQKMDAIGQLTGGVAHDFNNLLTVIVGNIQLAQSKLDGEPRLANWLATAERAANRGGDLTKRLLAFSRQQVLQAKPTRINKLVAEMEDMFRRTLGETIAIEVSLEPELWTVKVDDGELTNALLNLAVNARDAMPRGGNLTIETANVVLDGDYTRQHAYVEPGEYVMLAVSDSGVGIPEEIRQRIFEPFFTTKEAGKGTGLGMSMVYGFIKQSGGHIEIYSEVGTGTTVKIYLPRLRVEERLATEWGRADNGAAAEARREITVLVVEDDPDLRATLVSILEVLGYKVFQAADGPEALSKLDQNPAIDVLFTDYVMPGGLDGMELAEQARRRNPAMKALLTSGYTRRAVLRREELGDALDWIAKPYNKEEVANKLREVLGSEPTPDEERAGR